MSHLQKAIQYAGIVVCLGGAIGIYRSMPNEESLFASQPAAVQRIITLEDSLTQEMFVMQQHRLRNMVARDSMVFRQEEHARTLADAYRMHSGIGPVVDDYQHAVENLSTSQLSYKLGSLALGLAALGILAVATGPVPPGGQSTTDTQTEHDDQP